MHFRYVQFVCSFQVFRFSNGKNYINLSSIVWKCDQARLMEGSIEDSEERKLKRGKYERRN